MKSKISSFSHLLFQFSPIWIVLLIFILLLYQASQLDAQYREAEGKYKYTIWQDKRIVGYTDNLDIKSNCLYLNNYIVCGSYTIQNNRE